MKSNFPLSQIENKIVLLGYRGKVMVHEKPDIKNIQNKHDEDMYFTPLNPFMTGRALPDMYGVDIQANIISNISQVVIL